jgi:5-methylcytosine-specific restriction endonuclease McrA
MNARTLVLTTWEQPHKIISWERAICMVVKDKVEVLRAYEAVIPSERISIAVPAVVKLRREIPRGKRSTRFGRMSVYLRDGFRCGYCGKRFAPAELTYDHVVPRQHGGMTNWENIVTACWEHNQKKRNRTPAQAGMKLLFKPYRPEPGSLPPMPFFPPKDPPDAWKEFLAANDVAA